MLFEFISFEIPCEKREQFSKPQTQVLCKRTFISAGLLRLVECLNYKQGGIQSQ